MPMKFSEALGNGEAQQLVERLSALKSEWPSEPSLHNLSPQTVDALISRFTYIDSVVPMWKYAALFSILLPLVVALVLLLYAAASGWFKLGFPAAMALFALYSVFCAWRVKRSLMRGKWPYIVYALTQTDDVRVLETLILATRYKWGRHVEVIKAINRLLEQVTEADVGLLSDPAQKRLWTVGVTWQTLVQPYNHAGAIRALRALAAVGNRATMARMERFAYSSEYFLGERYAKAATRDLLPILKARLERQQVPETLLRASDANNTHPDTLLRAVHVSTPEPAAQLLRAATSEYLDTDA